MTLDDDCSLTLQVSDFVPGSSDNCSSNFAISFSSDSLVSSLNFNACNIGTSTVGVWATDGSGNTSHCEAELELETNANGCDCDPVLGGKIETDIGPDIANVKVRVTSPSDFSKTTYSNLTGNFMVDIVAGLDYEITPEKDTLPANGVTTFDLVLIRRHILGSDTLETPYKLIAADANNSGAITTFDLVEIRKLILQINIDFPNNKSWRFVDANYVFPNPFNPFDEPFPESIFVNRVVEDTLDIKFIGIKIGDVNRSASTSDLAEPGEPTDGSQ
jgi:hypothetical protein